MAKQISIVLLVVASLVTADVVPIKLPALSRDGKCGSSLGLTCLGSQFGGCCGADGRCGSTPEYCGDGCQIGYGYCQSTKGKTSPDGTCG